MLRVETPGGGESLLVAASRLRLATQALLRRRLRRTKHGLREGEEARPPGNLLAALASAPIPEAGVPSIPFTLSVRNNSRSFIRLISSDCIPRPPIETPKPDVKNRF